jgi:hypothetical protein
MITSQNRKERYSAVFWCLKAPIELLIISISSCKKKNEEQQITATNTLFQHNVSFASKYILYPSIY